MEALSLPETFARIKQAGYDGIEAVVAPDEADEFMSLVAQYDFVFIGIYADIIPGKLHDGTFAHYCDRLEFLAGLEPDFINAQTGKDSFSFEENASLIEAAAVISAKAGVPIYHELHRGKWSFCPQTTMPMLDRFPTLRMTADISHWVTVSESFLEDYAEAIDRLVARTAHVHARVGFTEGPQIPDPRAPEWAFAVEHHLTWWDRMIETQRQAEQPLITMSPEFGPYPYMPMLPFENAPVVDQWAVNCYMKTLLSERYND